MIVIHVTRNPDIVGDDVIRKLNETLPMCAAVGLSCSDPGGDMGKADVEIRIHEAHSLDTHARPLMIEVWANPGSFLSNYLEQLTKKFAELICQSGALPAILVGTNKVFVIVRLTKSESVKI
jgi:hypothetical protein